MPLDCRTGKSRLIWVAVLVLVAGVLIALIMTQTDPRENAIVQETKEGNCYERLEGKWIRPDGGYVIEIKNVSKDGSLDCSYFNPSSIHVSQAQASKEGEDIKLFIELRDTGYPGCTYDLTYEPKGDQLRGVYHQTALQQRYNIFFNRAN